MWLCCETRKKLLVYGIRDILNIFDRRGYNECCDVTNANTTPEACADINDLHCTTCSDTLQQCQTQENQT